MQKTWFHMVRILNPIRWALISSTFSHAHLKITDSRALLTNFAFWSPGNGSKLSWSEKVEKKDAARARGVVFEQWEGKGQSGYSIILEENY